MEALLQLLTSALVGLGLAVKFLARLVVPRAGSNWGEIPRQISLLACSGLPSVLAVAIFIGGTATLMGYHAFLPLGTQAMVGSYAGLVCLRELAPLLAGAMIAAKSGTAWTATLANMRGSDQIAALEVMGVDPFSYLLAPRVLAFVLTAPLLVVFADAGALLASYGLAVVQLGVTPATFLGDLVRFIGMGDVWIGLLKGSVFAGLAGTIASYHGLYASGGPRGVSGAITRAMVAMAIADVLANFGLSAVFYR